MVVTTRNEAHFNKNCQGADFGTDRSADEEPSTAACGREEPWHDSVECFLEESQVRAFRDKTAFDVL